MLNLTRRFFLKSTGALAVYSGIAPVHAVRGMEKVLAAGGGKAVTRGKSLVVIFLRGGMDGLNFVVPHGESAYYDLRQAIAIDRPGSEDGAEDLDGHFGLHPAAQSLKPLFDAQTALAIHAVGYDENTRSHFEEQDTWETGVIGNTVNSDGWLNRHLLTSSGNGPVRAISVGSSLPRILQGSAPAFAIRGLQDIKLPGVAGNETVVGAALEHAYARDAGAEADAARDLLSEAGLDTLDAIRHLRRVASQPYRPVAAYPDTGLAKNLREVARLIKADIGLEVAEIDFGGWDTHNNQGGATGGYANRVRELTEGLSAFTTDLADRLEDVLVVTMSDFGRTARENGSRGTDHGWANCMLALGGPARRAAKQAGKPVIGTWPGLESHQLNQGRDLKDTTDFRDVLAEIVSVHLGNEHLKTVLPDHEFKPVGLVG